NTDIMRSLFHYLFSLWSLYMDHIGILKPIRVESFCCTRAAIILRSEAGLLQMLVNRVSLSIDQPLLLIAYTLLSIGWPLFSIAQPLLSIVQPHMSSARPLLPSAHPPLPMRIIDQLKRKNRSDHLRSLRFLYIF